MSGHIRKFTRNLLAYGAEILGPTNPYEVLRFKTSYGVGVIYKGKRGETWNPEAIAARDHMLSNIGSLAPVAITKRSKGHSRKIAILSRDGETCFFCGDALGGDMTIEHLVSIAHGGPNHISNMFLAHSRCNQLAGHMSAPEKIALAIRQRAAFAGKIEEY